MKPMSRFTGCIAAEQRRTELLEHVANQRAYSNQSAASTPLELTAIGFVGRFVSRLRNAVHYRPEWKASRVSRPKFVE
jgi:hypothetical protein